MIDIGVKTYIMGRMLDKIVEYVPLTERQQVLITNQPPPNFIRSRRAPTKIVFLSEEGNMNIIPTGMIQHWTWGCSRALKVYTTKWFTYE